MKNSLKQKVFLIFFTPIILIFIPVILFFHFIAHLILKLSNKSTYMRAKEIAAAHNQKLLKNGYEELLKLSAEPEPLIEIIKEQNCNFELETIFEVEPTDELYLLTNCSYSSLSTFFPIKVGTLVKKNIEKSSKK